MKLTWEIYRVEFSSVTQSSPTLCNPMNCSTPGFPVHHQFPEPAQTMSIESAMPPNHLILCHSLLLPTSIFPMSQFFTSDGQNIGVSASASVLQMNIQDRHGFPLGLTGLILQSKGLSIVLSNTTVQKHQFFGAQISLWSNSYIHTWWLEKP